MRLVYLLVAFALISVPAQAQTHPCDTVPVVNPTIQTSTPVSIGFCHVPVDASGNSTVITSYRLAIDGATVFTGALTAIGAANASGAFYFETPKTITVAKGAHSVVEYASNADGEGLGSDPYAFTVKGLPPGKGKVDGVIK